MKALSQLQLNMLHASSQYDHYPIQIGCFLDVSHLEINFNKIESFFHNIVELHQTIQLFVQTPYWINTDQKPKLVSIHPADTQAFFEAPFELNTPFYRIAMDIETKRLLFVANHILLDGTSIQYLMKSLYLHLQDLPMEGFSKAKETQPIQQDAQAFFEGKIKQCPPTYIKPYHHFSGVHPAKRKHFILKNHVIAEFNTSFSLSTWIEAAMVLYLFHLHPKQLLRYGMVFSQRKSAEKTALGMFSQVYPIHIDITENPTIETFLNRIETAHRQVFRRRFIDFESLLSCSKIHHQTTQLFDFTIINQTRHYDEYIPIEPLFYPYLDQSLVINILEGNDTHLYLDYQIDVYSEPMIDRLFKRILHIMNQLNKCIRVSDVSVLFEDELPITLPKVNLKLLDLYYQNLEDHLKNIAIIDEAAITYQKLEADSNRLSHALLNTSTETIVIEGHKTYKAILTMMAVIKAGKPFVFYTSETKSFLNPPIDIDALDWQHQSPLYIDYPKNPILAYYFTSGTQGRKQIAITCEALANHLIGAPYITQAKNLKRIPLLSALHFDMSLEEIWVALLHKITLVLMDDETFKQPSKRANRFELYPVDGITTTPSMIKILMDDPKIMAHLNWLVLGGETLTPGLARSILAYPNIQLFNSYGPTETTIAVTSTKIDANRPISIGKAHSNTQVMIFNDKPLPWGEVGEIYVQGIQVSPSVNTVMYEDKSFYPTGDIGYQDELGYIYFIGRRDKTIKRHRVRIDLNWIDQKIQQHPSVIQVRSVFNQNQIITYVQPNHSLDEDTLWQHINHTLSPQHRPNRLVFTQNITQEGKIETRDHVKQTPFKPNNLKEKAIFHALSIVLNHADFNLEDVIATHGGDSLSVIQILSILDQYGYAIDAEHLETKTISDIIRDTYKRNIAYKQLKHHTKNLPIEVSDCICLYGSNGFLGIHVLDTLINQTNASVICPLRVSQAVLEETYRYYHKKNLDTNRVQVIPFNANIEDLNVDLIINASGYTKYQGKPEIYDHINVDFVIELANKAKDLNIPLVHISTVGIGSYERVFDEVRRRIRMTFSNPYLTSKAKAEVALSEINGLNYKIIRVGNLTPSLNQKVPQLNGDNAFMKGLSNLIHHQNSNLYGIHFDITPVDVASQAIVAFLRTSMTIGHVIHPNRYHYDGDQKGIVLNPTKPVIQSKETQQALKNQGFKYPNLDTDYLKALIEIAEKNRDV